MTPAKLKENVEAWAKLRQQREKIEAQTDGQLEDLFGTFEKKAEPIYTARDRKLDPIIEEMDRLEATIREELLGQLKANRPLPQIESTSAIAQVFVERRREIDPAAFFRAVAPRRRNEPAFLACLTVQVGKAEKFLDQPTMTRIARAKLNPSVNLALKDQ
jgi:hypothetical protein